MTFSISWIIENAQAETHVMGPSMFAEIKGGKLGNGD
jgi:hypothetical protein